MFQSKAKSHKKHLRPVAEGLARLLSDTYLLMTKTHAFSWNMSYKDSPEVIDHLRIQSQMLWAAIGDMSLQVRRCGLYCPEATSEMRSLAAIREDHHLYDQHDMVMRLQMDNDVILKRCKEVLELAEEAQHLDAVTLAEKRLCFHRQWRDHLSQITDHEKVS